MFGLLALEIGKTIFIVRAELKYRLYATRITLVAEVLQSLILQGFLLLCASLLRKSFKDVVSNE